MAGFSGVRGSASYTTNETVENWRSVLMRQYPNGKALLTGLTSKMKKQPVDFPIFHWFTEAYRNLEVDVTAVYSDAALATAISVNTTAAGTTVNVKMSAEAVSNFRPGHQILLRNEDVPSVDVNARVVSVTSNGASSALQVVLLQADHSHATYGLSTCTTAGGGKCQLIGDVNPENGETPQSIDYDPTDEYNYTQIIKTPVRISRTAMHSNYRTGDMYKDAKTRAFEQHMESLERVFLFGYRSTGTGSNGMPMKTTMGLIPYIQTNASANCIDYRYSSTYSGKTWTQGGKDFFFSTIEQASRYGEWPKACFCGSTALLGLNYLAETYSNITIAPGATKWGLNFKTLITPWGELELVQHPMFNVSSVDRNRMVIFNPNNITYRPLDDTFFKKGQPLTQNSSNGSVDGIVEEWITEAGLEMTFANECAILDGVGSDNDLT